MDLIEHSYSTLIVSAADKFNTSLQELLPDFKYSPVQFESNVSSAKRLLLERDFDYVIINSPLPDSDGIRFSIDVCTNNHAIVLILVRNELYDSVFERVSPHGVFTLAKPISRQMISQSLDFMASTHARFKKLKKKTVSLEDKMQEIRIINRAKWILIEQLKMTEEDSHRYIEKQAMDRCVSKREIAEKIIKTYG